MNYFLKLVKSFFSIIVIDLKESLMRFISSNFFIIDKCRTEDQEWKR